METKDYYPEDDIELQLEIERELIGYCREHNFEFYLENRYDYDYRKDITYVILPKDKEHTELSIYADEKYPDFLFSIYFPSLYSAKKWGLTWN